jgi:(hydroxyamino)benzene mutase
MHDHDAPAAWGHRLLQFGVLLFLVGLLTGFVIPALANPRMALASHLEGIMNGLFLIALGLIWPRLVLGRGALGAIYGFALYGTFVNWAATLLAAIWGAGAPMMPIAAGRAYRLGHAGKRAHDHAHHAVGGDGGRVRSRAGRAAETVLMSYTRFSGTM